MTESAAPLTGGRNLSKGSTVPYVDLNAARAFFERAAHAPLLQHVGELIEDSTVEKVASWEAALPGIQSHEWVVLINRMNNHLRGRIALAWGMDWYQRDYVASVNSIVALYPDAIHGALLRVKAGAAMPDDAINSIGVWVKGIAMAYAFAEAVPVCFYREYFEQWILKGHFPCGWKGKLPREPRSAGKHELHELLGSGRLIVY